MYLTSDGKSQACFPGRGVQLNDTDCVIDMCDLRWRVGGESQHLETFEEFAITFHHPCDTQIYCYGVASQCGIGNLTEVAGDIWDGVPVRVDSR